MFSGKNDRNNTNCIEKVKNHQMKPSFIEEEILIPQIVNQIETISLLFEEMKERHLKLQDENTDDAQDFKKDLIEMLRVYNQTKFPSRNPADMKKMDNAIKNEVDKMKKSLLGGISNHLEQYRKLLKDLGSIHNQESSMEKISEYMIRVQSFMSHIIQFKKKIFSHIMPMTTLVMINSKTNEEIKRFPKNHPAERIGLLQFDTTIDEIASLCESGIKSINSWFDHLKSRKIQYSGNIVNQSKVQAAQEQTKAAKWTFYTQLGFMVLSVLFILVSFCLAEYKENWINLFNNEQKVTKDTMNKNGATPEPLPTKKGNTDNKLHQEKDQKYTHKLPKI